MRPLLATALAASLAASAAHAQSLERLRTYYFPVTQDNLSAADSTFPLFPPPGFYPLHTEGYVFPPTNSPPPGLLYMRRLDRWFSPSLEDNRTTTNPAWQGSPGDTRAPDYQFITHEGWLFTDVVAGTSEVRSYVNGQISDTRLTADTRHTTTNFIPGYSSAGWEGQIVNDPKGREELLNHLDCGTMFYALPAFGIRPMLIILISYSDVPMRHVALQYENLFFGSAFPNVNGAFWVNSMGSLLWSNEGIRGPLVLANDPDTTFLESRWVDTWDPTFEPFLYLTLRTSDGEHAITAYGAPFTGASADGFGNGPFDVLSLWDNNASNLTSGDDCSFKTVGKTWLRVLGDDLRSDGASRSLPECRFTITKVSGSAGSQVRHGDIIRLQSVATGKLLRAVDGGGGDIQCDVTTPGTGTDFTIMKSGPSYALQPRQALDAAVAAGLNLAPYDTDGSGVVTGDELQLVLIGGSRDIAAGAGARSTFTYQPVGSTVAVDFAKYVGAGEDFGFATMVHELSHSLGANYEMYGAYSTNQDIAVMGATIYPTADDRRTYLHDPWTRMRFGWLRPRIHSITDIGASATLEVSDEYPEADDKRPILLVDPLKFDFSTGEGEYFMLEYRNPDLSPTSYDTNCAAKGLYIWQCKTGPGGANIVLPAAAGACCTGPTCGILHQEICLAPSVYKGDGTVCDPADACPAGTPPVTKIDGSINVLGPFVLSDGSQVLLRGWPAPWTTANQPEGGIVPSYTDDSPAPLHIRIGKTSADGRSIRVEWSYTGELPPRIDSLSRLRVRRGTKFDINGMFGVDRPDLKLYTPGGALVSLLAFPVQDDLARISDVNVSPDAALGTFHLKAEMGAARSNTVQLTIVATSDWNLSATLSPQDIFDYLNDWFAAAPGADYNNSGHLTVADIFDFINDWFQGI